MGTEISGIRQYRTLATGLRRVVVAAIGLTLLAAAAWGR